MMNRVLRYSLCVINILSLLTAAQNRPAHAETYAPRTTTGNGSASGFYASLTPGETTGLSANEYGRSRVTGAGRYASPGITNILYASEAVNVSRQGLVTVVEAGGGRDTENVGQPGGYVSRLCRMIISSF